MSGLESGNWDRGRDGVGQEGVVGQRQRATRSACCICATPSQITARTTPLVTGVEALYLDGERYST
jgi:hypothetical protein